jgi:ribosomal-protein-alanine N-acetyltransferase
MQAMQQQATDRFARQRVQQQIHHTPASSAGLPVMRQVNWLVDLPAIVAIENESFAQPWSFCTFVSFMNKSNTGATVAVLRGKVVGFMLHEVHLEGGSARNSNVERLHVAHIAVSKDCRNMGIGSTLVNSLSSTALSLGAATSLNVRRSNRLARELYKSLGFAVVRVLSGHYADGEDALVMEFAGA